MRSGTSTRKPGRTRMGDVTVEIAPVRLAVQQEEGAVGVVTSIDVGHAQAGDQDIARRVRIIGDLSEAGGRADVLETGGCFVDWLGVGEGEEEGKEEEEEEEDGVHFALVQAKGWR